MCGREDRLVLAAQQRRHLRRHTPEDLTLGVDDVPATLDVLRLRRVGLHTWKIGRAEPADDPCYLREREGVKAGGP